MLLLTNPTDKLQVVTSAACTLDVHVSWMDYADGIITPGRANTAIVAATTTDIVPVPAVGVRRNVKGIFIRNKHASTAVDVTVQYEGSSVDADVQLYKATLVAGALLEFNDDGGFKLLPSVAVSTGHTIEDEGIAVTARTSLNFTGAGVTVVDSGGKTVVTITGNSSAHASTHAAAGSDPVTITEAQVTNLTTDLAAKQPLDGDLTSIAALATTSYGRGLLTAVDSSALRTTAGLVIGTDVSAAYASVNSQTASYTLVISDDQKVVEMNVASANNLTVPLNSSVAFPIGATIEIYQYGAGQTTIVPTGGVTIRSAANKLKLTGQYSTAALIKRATDEWRLVGDLTN